MDIVYLLVPLSVVLVFLIVAVFWWSVQSGQFDDLERHGRSVLDDDETRRDAEAETALPRGPESGPPGPPRR